MHQIIIIFQVKLSLPNRANMNPGNNIPLPGLELKIHDQ